MKIGAIFPHDTIEPDAGAICAHGEAVEQMGFSHIMSCDPHPRLHEPIARKADGWLPMPGEH